MRRLLLAFGAILLAGCVESQPVLLVHQTGSNYADRLRAIDTCEFEAIRAVPRAMATEVSGGYHDPGSVQCSTIGGLTTCNRVGGINIPATATTYDANQGIRDRYMARCLEDRGYAIYPKPACRTDAERAAFSATMDNQPPASEIPCAASLR